MTPLAKYRISGLHEETECNYCGCPLYHGETAYTDSCGAVYCSRTCRNRDEYDARQDYYRNYGADTQD